MTYIDPTTELPQNLGEIYSDRNIRIVGRARINPSNANQIDTLDIQVLCTPIGGGAEGISNITNGTYTLSGTGSSLWVKITRSGTATVTPEIYAAGAQPKSRRDYVQVFYQTAPSQIISDNTLFIPGPLYLWIGYGHGQHIFDAIVGETGDIHSTHTELQIALNEIPDNGWVLVKKICLVASTINTGGKRLKIVFSGVGSGLTASGATTGFRFDQPGCQLIGFGTISGFTYAVDLNGKVGCRIEMNFTGNTNNINYGTLSTGEVAVEGSYGLASFGAVPIGGMIAVMPTTLPNSWQPPAQGFVKDGFMRADGGVVPAGCIIPQGTILPNMLQNYPKGGATSGATDGSNTVSLSVANIPQMSSTVTSTTVSADHTHTATTGDAGAHAHGATTGDAGAHAHGATTGDAGAHAHNAKHTHDFSMQGGGNHTHDILANGNGTGMGNQPGGGDGGSPRTYHTEEAGIHGHTLIINENNFNTADQVAHSHSIPNQVAHSHTLTTGGISTNHTHNVTVTVGSAVVAAHNNEPAYVVVVWVIRVK